MSRASECTEIMSKYACFYCSPQLESFKSGGSKEIGPSEILNFFDHVIKNIKHILCLSL